MTPLEKLSIFILSETGKFSDSEISDFMGCSLDDVKMYSRPSPYRFGSYFRQREIKILRSLVDDERANVKVAISLTDDMVRLGHLAKVNKELKKLSSKFLNSLMVFNLSDLTEVESEYEIKH